MSNNHWYYYNNTNAALKANNPIRKDKIKLRKRLIDNIRESIDNPICYNFRKGRDYQRKAYLNIIHERKTPQQRSHKQHVNDNKNFLMARQNRNTKNHTINVTFKKQPFSIHKQAENEIKKDEEEEEKEEEEEETMEDDDDDDDDDDDEWDQETMDKLKEACLEYTRKLKEAESNIPLELKNYNPAHIGETDFFIMGVSVPSDDEEDKNYIYIDSDSDEWSSADEDDGEKLISDEDDESEEEEEDDSMRRGTGCDCPLHTEITECFSCSAAECDNCTWKFYKHDRSKFPHDFVDKDEEDEEEKIY